MSEEETTYRNPPISMAEASDKLEIHEERIDKCREDVDEAFLFMERRAVCSGDAAYDLAEQTHSEVLSDIHMTKSSVTTYTLFMIVFIGLIIGIGAYYIQVKFAEHSVLMLEQENRIERRLLKM